MNKHTKYTNNEEYWIDNLQSDLSEKTTQHYNRTITTKINNCKTKQLAKNKTNHHKTLP